MQYRKITFIGAGNMAQAIISGLVMGGYPAKLICVCAPSTKHRDRLMTKLGIISSADNVTSARKSEVIVLAVKPQVMIEVCRPLREHVDFTHKLVLSIATGIQTSCFYQLLSERLNLVRIMPNIPSLVGKGMSGLYAPTQVSEENRTFTSDLMNIVGKVYWVDNETDINHIIAVSGSAPAYFFIFMEAIQLEAMRMGFDWKTARNLVQQVASGATALSEANAHKPFSRLCDRVASKNGATDKALQVFKRQKLQEMVGKAMRAAVMRAQEIENNLK